MRIHIRVENVADGHTATVVVNLDGVALRYVVLLAHPAVLILVGHYFILDLAEKLIEVVYLIAHVVDVSLYLGGLGK